MKSSRRTREVVGAVFIAAGAGFVLLLHFFADSEYRSEAILVALVLWALAAALGLLAFPRHVLEYLRRTFGDYTKRHDKQE
jgi:hypothetical protein